MRVLITTYHEAFLHKGGGEFEVITLANNLQKYGVIADIYGPFCQNIENYDLVIHFSLHRGGLELIKEIKANNKKIILIPNFYTNNENNIDYETVNVFCNLVDVIVFHSNAMKNHFNKFFTVDYNKIKILDYMVDNKILKSVDKNLFSSLYDIENYALCFGIIEENKNQLKTIEILKQLNKQLVLVGQYRDYDYYKKCVDVANNVLFIESLAYHSDIMLSALYGCDFYIELSREPAGFSAIEASMVGCNVILTDMEWSREIFSNNIEFIDIDNDSDDKILEKVKRVELKEKIKIPNKDLSKHLISNSIFKFIDLLKDLLSDKK